MKLSRSLTVLACAIVLTTGAVVTVNAVTTTAYPVKLCAKNVGRAISAPLSNGNCPSGTTEFFVARAADVQALAARADALEGDVEALKGDRAAIKVVGTVNRAGDGFARPWGAMTGTTLASSDAGYASVPTILPPGTWTISNFTATVASPPPSSVRISVVDVTNFPSFFDAYNGEVTFCELKPPSDTSCVGANGNLQGGRRYAFLVNASFGTFFDIGYSYTLRKVS